MDIQTLYQQATRFAAAKHSQQTIPGSNLPYVVHLSNVAMEIIMASQHTPGFDLGFAVQVALLHDVLEDTEAGYEELVHAFSPGVAMAVAALTKNDTLPKEEKMPDSLQRIKQLAKELWAVKLADRITNLQKPPAHWSLEKIKSYLQEAAIILENLNGGNTYLEERLAQKIEAYKTFTIAD